MHAENYTLHRCTVADVQDLELIGKATFLETFAGVLDGRAIVTHCGAAHSASAYTELLSNGAYAWLARTSPGSAPVGYVLSGPSSLPAPFAEHGDVELKRIYLLNRFHGLGMGARLLDIAETHAGERGARRLLLGVYAQNTAAQRFYGRKGFTAVGARQFHVGGVAYDDFVMAKAL